MSDCKTEVAGNVKISDVAGHKKRFADYFAIIGLEIMNPDLEPENHESKFICSLSFKFIHFSTCK